MAGAGGRNVRKSAQVEHVALAFKGFEPLLDQPPRDRIAARQAEPVVVRMLQDEITREPMRRLELIAVEADVAGAGAGVKPSISEDGNGQGCEEW